MAQPKQIEVSKLKTFANAAAGHDGVLQDEGGEVVVKPCTQAEIDFYQESLTAHPKFYELMPEYMGTLQLGAPTAHIGDAAPLSQEAKDKSRLHGQALATSTSIVLENLEYGFKRPNVLDLKLGARLWADGTDPAKAARLDAVAAETTSGSLHFRIAGMKVWTGQSYEVHDKFYGRKFSAATVKDGFAAFFAGLGTSVRADDARQILETVLAEVTKARHSLERSQSRMFGASILIVYEGDAEALEALLGGAPPKTPRAEEKAPTAGEVKRSVREEEEEEEGEEAPPVTHRVKMIDFAHAKWTPGEGRDENVITGLMNVEEQMDGLIARFEEGWSGRAGEW